MRRPPQNLLYQIALAAALSSGLFVVLLTGLLGYTTIRGKVATLVDSREVVRLREALRQRPKDAELKQRIRRLDLQLRQETFYRLRLSHTASRALLGGLAIFLLSAHFARTARPALPDPVAWGARQPAAERRQARGARYATAGVFALAAFVAVLVSRRPAVLPAPGPAAARETPPTLEEFNREWPAFRGPQGLGVADQARVGPPLRVRWKTPVPLPGMSSPILWGDALFLTGANETENRVFRFDADTGALVWSAPVNAPKPPTSRPGEDTGFAAPTAVTDGRRVYAIFADGLVGAFDFAGKQQWARNVGPVENAYGYASSPALYQDRLLIQIDRGYPDEGLSRLVALETRTGRELWEVERAVAGSWASPVVLTVDGEPQLITCAAPWVIGYDPLGGAERWRIKCLESDVAPSPILAGNVLVAVAPNMAVYGLRPGAADPLWKAEDGVPDACSPVSDGRRVYLVDAAGLLTCLDLDSGTVAWQQELEGHFYASPTLAGPTLVLVDRDGVVRLVATGDGYQELGRTPLGEDCNASPAPRGNRLYIRGTRHLFCLETATGQ